MDPLGCPETSVTTKSTLLKIQEDRRSNFHRGGSVKSRMFLTATFPLLWRWEWIQLGLWTKNKRPPEQKDVIPLRDVYHAALLLNNFWLFSLFLRHSIHVLFPCNWAIAFYAKEPWLWTLHNAFTLPKRVVKVPQVYTQHVTSYLLGWGSNTVINCTVSKYVHTLVNLCVARLNLLKIPT